MKIAKRTIKENLLIDAAEKVFASVGFKNAKMSDIAKEAGITKVTLYSYFQSKENLYMAVTYRAFQLLLDMYYKTIDEYKNETGLESSLAMMRTFMNFCTNNFLYSETMLEYLALIRSTEQGRDTARLTEAMKESLYYRRIQDIQQLPFKLATVELNRGLEDGSIISKKSPMFLTLHVWSTIIGFAKVLSTSGPPSATLFDINLNDLMEYSIKLVRLTLVNKEIQDQL